jgi:hypothetical protein
VDLAYKRDVDQRYSYEFVEVNNKLQILGINIKSAPSISWCTTPGEANYKGIHETLHCTAGKVMTFILTAEFVTRWNEQSSAFDKYLTASGWEKISYNASAEPIGTIYNVQYDTAREEVYEKRSGKTICKLNLNYNPFVDHTYRAAAEESCSRDVKFFGGLNGY